MKLWPTTTSTPTPPSSPTQNGLSNAAPQGQSNIPTNPIQNVPSVHHHPHPIMEQAAVMVEATVVETAVVAVMVEAVVANNT